MFTSKSSLAKLLAPTILLGAGLFSLVIMVNADNATTSVTVGNAVPSDPVINFNYGNAITLTEGTYRYATASITVSDANGCATINHISATARLASTSAAASYFCADNDLSCYNTGSTTAMASACIASTTANGCTGVGDTSAVYDCGFKLWYIARATAATAPQWASSIWVVSATSSDGVATTTATNTGQTVEIEPLNALQITSSISYGTLAAGANTGATNSTTTATTTGNVAIDASISEADDLSSGANNIAAANQEYKATPFTIGAGVALTTSPTTLELTSGYPTATTSDPYHDISWGISIPNGQPAGAYTGTNAIDAVAD